MSSKFQGWFESSGKGVVGAALVRSIQKVSEAASAVRLVIKTSASAEPIFADLVLNAPEQTVRAKIKVHSTYAVNGNITESPAIDKATKAPIMTKAGEPVMNRRFYPVIGGWTLDSVGTDTDAIVLG